VYRLRAVHLSHYFSAVFGLVFFVEKNGRPGFSRRSIFAGEVLQAPTIQRAFNRGSRLYEGVD
jgi:hypothetical protein